MTYLAGKFFISESFCYLKSLKTLKVCQKQGKKINKYKYRTDRVLKDILWHIIGVKRCNEFNWSGKYISGDLRKAPVRHPSPFSSRDDQPTFFFYSGRKRRQIDYQDEEPEYEDENFDYMTEENEDLLDLVLDDSNNVSMIATQNLGFEGKADDDVKARKEFSKIVNHDFQFYKQKIRDINLNGKSVTSANTHFNFCLRLSQACTDGVRQSFRPFVEAWCKCEFD